MKVGARVVAVVVGLVFWGFSAHASWQGCEKFQLLGEELGFKVETHASNPKRNRFVTLSGGDLSETVARRIFELPGEFVSSLDPIYSSCPAYQNVLNFDCAARLRFLEATHQASVSSGKDKEDPAQEIARKFAASEARVLMIGESHINFEGIKYLSQILRAAKAAEPELNCLFIENSTLHQRTHDEYGAGKLTDDELIAKIRQEAVGVIRKGDDAAGGVDPLLSRTARELGVRVIPVDRESYGRSSLRDIAMAEVMNESFVKGCRRAMLRVGKAHLVWKRGAANLFCASSNDCYMIDMMMPADDELTQSACVALGFKAPPNFHRLAHYPVRRGDPTVLDRFFLDGFRGARPVGLFDGILVVPKMH